MTLEGTEVSISNLLQLDDDVEILTSLDIASLSQNLVYPNPATEFIHIDLSDSLNYSFSIFSVDGTPMVKNIPLSAQHDRIDVGGYGTGTYLLLIMNIEDNQYQLLKFIKQ